MGFPECFSLNEQRTSIAYILFPSVFWFQNRLKKRDVSEVYPFFLFPKQEFVLLFLRIEKFKPEKHHHVLLPFIYIATADPFQKPITIQKANKLPRVVKLEIFAYLTEKLLKSQRFIRNGSCALFEIYALLILQ
ncbi:MAG: hypothetical protein EA391_04840 [Balneolaceae bacterium]|nr:MAG: hypothetical protein EA391_04840 [Balneolaceae bacterium]